jgi:uncharacterized protein (DUF302 family)
MKPMTLGIIIGILAGILLTVLVLYLAAPGLMFRESKSTLTFDATVDKVEAVAAAHDWKIPAIHDLQATMKKFGKDVRAVKVFEICHPDHSYKILSNSEERIVSSMMPCRIAVYEKEDGSVWLSRMNSGIMAKPLSKVVRTTMTDATKDVEVIIAEVLAE